MSKIKRKNKKDNENKYNAENEIIIGVTTKPKAERIIKSKNSIISKKTKKNPYKKTNKTKKANIEKERIIKNKNRKRKIISFIIVLFIAIAGFIYYLTTPRFNISNIVIKGNEKYSENVYISLSQITLNETNIFQITDNTIKRRLKENPYVEDIEIKRIYPNTLELNIKERKIKYQFKYNDKYVYIDEQGYILEMNEEKKDVVELIGILEQKDNITNIKRLENSDLLKLEVVTKIINYCDNNIITEKISKIDVSNQENYTLYFDEEGKIAYIGDASNLNERMLWLKTILQKEKENKGQIFINGDLSKNKVYFKEGK